MATAPCGALPTRCIKQSLQSRSSPGNAREKQHLQVFCKWHGAVEGLEKGCKWAKYKEKYLAAMGRSYIWARFLLKGIS